MQSADDCFSGMTSQGRPASAGSGLERYSVRIPFSIEPLGKFPQLDDVPFYEKRPLQIGSRRALIERYPSLYVLHVPDFGQRSEAERYLEHASVGLLRLSIEREMAIEFSSAPVDLDISPHNTPFRESFARQHMASWQQPDGTFTDAGLFPHFTAIVPAHQRVWEFPMFFGREVRQVDLDLLRGAIATAQSIRDPAAILNDEKLTLAIHTFASAHNTWDREAKFIFLTTVLEILRRDRKRPQRSQQIIDDLLKYLGTCSSAGNDEKREIRQLRNDLGQLRQRSIAAGICELAYTARPANSRQATSRIESDKDIRQLYNIRSKLVHEGSVPHDNGTPKEVLMRGFEKLRVVAQEVLRYCMDQHS